MVSRFSQDAPVRAWDDLLACVQAGDATRTARLVESLRDADRKVVAAGLPRCLAGHGPERAGWWEWDRRLSPLLVAGAGCLSGAAAVTAWLLRREFRRRAGHGDVASILRLLRRRPVEWQADVALRLARRLRHADLWPWEVAAALVRETGVRPPDGDAFMTGWLRQLTPDTAAGDRLLAAYGPRLFEIDGLALVDVWRVVESVVRLVDNGLLERAAVIDGLIGRLLRDGPSALSPLAGLHDRLDPDLDEAAARARDYARLLPAGPVAVADMALAQLRRLEEAGRLEEELFADALEALAFRPEKKLLRATLSWAGDAVLRDPAAIARPGSASRDGASSARPSSAAGAGPRRADTALRAMAMIFRQDTPALQERAVRLAVGLAGQAGADGHEAVRDAAAALPAELREKIAAAYGGGIAEPETTVAPPAAARDGRRMPPPFGSPEELAHALTAFTWPPGPYDFERLLAGLAEWSHRAPGQLRAALRPWWHPFDPHLFGRFGDVAYETIVEALLRAFLAFASPHDSRTLSEGPPKDDRWAAARGTLDELYVRRARELTTRFEDGGAYPVVLATPTTGTGHIDPGTLLDRLDRLEAAGVRALPADLTQALLRLPREIPAADVTRAGRLTSEAGRACAAWMRVGRLGDPQVTLSLRGNARYGSASPELHATITLPDAPDTIRELLRTRPAYLVMPAWWPPVMPSHRDVVAAHLAESLFASMDSGDGQAQALTDLAHGEGPLGAGMAYALACGMGHARAADRAAATDALLTLAARGEVPAAELGEVVTTLAGADHLKLNRLVSALDDATQAGAHEAVWAVIAGLLPGVLPVDGERPRAGLADLLAAGARAARIAGVRADLPEVAEIAARKGSSRLVQEARRLRQLVAS